MEALAKVENGFSRFFLQSVAQRQQAQRKLSRCYFANSAIFRFLKETTPEISCSTAVRAGNSSCKT
jgi:hypothetical protein